MPQRRVNSTNISSPLVPIIPNELRRINNLSIDDCRVWRRNPLHVYA